MRNRKLRKLLVYIPNLMCVLCGVFLLIVSAAGNKPSTLETVIWSAVLIIWPVTAAVHMRTSRLWRQNAADALRQTAEWRKLYYENRSLIREIISAREMN